MKTLVCAIIFCLLLVIASKADQVFGDGVTARYLFMQPNSTAHIYIKFGGAITDNKTKYKEVLDAYTGRPPHNVSISDTPHAVINGSTMIDYKITASSNTRGMYGIQLGNCGLSPLVIGLDTDEINASIFVKNFLQAYPCPFGNPASDGVQVGQSGLVLKTITIVYDESGKPVISNGGTLNAVSTDKPYYVLGDKITITGRVSGTGMLYLKVLNPFQNPVLSKYFFPRQDGTFSQTMLASGPLWSVTGNYTVEVNGPGMSNLETVLYLDSSTPPGAGQVMELQAPPLDQLKSGVAVENIQCNRGLILVIKTENESPACVTPQTGQTLAQRGWAAQVGTDIILQRPSSDARPFPICNSNPAKEKLIREKQKALEDAVSGMQKHRGQSGNNVQQLPWSTIGYDCVDNALEVGIPPQYFNHDALPKYFEMIRSIVGYGIDVALSPQGYATTT